MSVLRIDGVSRWFGNVVAVNDISMSIGPGVTGLLGPNGAGKSTLINMMGGFLAPSSGTVTLDGTVIWGNEEIYRHIGIVPEREAMYDFLTGLEFVRANAELHGLPASAAQRALATVEMEYAQDRRIATYSKGMRQRVKMASALVHDPSVLLLDEPFNGMDPRQRMQLMDLLRQMGSEGRTVLFSSHILEEVEQIAAHIEVVVAGRHAASGDFRKIRRLMTNRPAPLPGPFQRRPGPGRGPDLRPLDGGHRGGRPGGRPAHPGRGLRPVHHPAAGRGPGPWHPAPDGLALRRVPGIGLLLPRRGLKGGADPMNSIYHPTVARLTYRGLLGRRRAAVLFTLPALLLIIAAAIRLLTGPDDETATKVLGGFALATMVPLIGVIAGTGAIGPEIDDGSVVYLLAKPVKRPTIVLTKLIVATGVTAVFSAVPTLLAGLLLNGNSQQIAVAYAVAAAAASLAYSAVFLLLGTVTRHAVVAGAGLRPGLGVAVRQPDTRGADAQRAAVGAVARRAHRGAGGDLLGCRTAGGHGAVGGRHGGGRLVRGGAAAQADPRGGGVSRRPGPSSPLRRRSGRAQIFRSRPAPSPRNTRARQARRRIVIGNDQPSVAWWTAPTTNGPAEASR
ncbi:hypothetical protein GCM10020221_28700 [Streptomyces thioluteus]|uniref:ABC transporter domain-containing protein n=1 Tax=Streptomyces thioluteus TaxID=66431 RepID=A0ABN3WZ79_STRTU